MDKRFWRMFRYQWHHPPNIVTLIRLLGAALLPVIMALEIGISFPENSVFTGSTGAFPQAIVHLGFWTAYLFALTAATDKLDGFLAKAIFGKTELGTILDPLVDKVLMLISVIVALLATAARGELTVAEFLFGLGLFLAFREKDVFRLKKAAAKAEGVVTSARQSGRVSMVVFCVAMGVTLLPIVGPWSSLAKAALLVLSIVFSRRSWNDYRRSYGTYAAVQ